jgi:hypothetical protein
MDFNAFLGCDFEDLVMEGEADEIINIVAKDSMQQPSHYGRATSYKDYQFRTCCKLRSHLECVIERIVQKLVVLGLSLSQFNY